MNTLSAAAASTQHFDGGRSTGSVALGGLITLVSRVIDVGTVVEGVGRLATPHFVRKDTTCETSCTVVTDAVFQTMVSANVTGHPGHTWSVEPLEIAVTVAAELANGCPSTNTVLTPVLPWFTTVNKRHWFTKTESHGQPANTPSSVPPPDTTALLSMLPPVGMSTVTPASTLESRVMAPAPAYDPNVATGCSNRMYTETVQSAPNGPQVDIAPTGETSKQ